MTWQQVFASWVRGTIEYIQDVPPRDGGGKQKSEIQFIPELRFQRSDGHQRNHEICRLCVVHRCGKMLTKAYMRVVLRGLIESIIH